MCHAFAVSEMDTGTLTRDVLATVMMSRELFCTSDHSSPAVKGSVDLKLDQAAVFRSGEVPMGAVPSLCTVSLLF